MGATEITVEPGRHDIVITRSFDAPRELVFKALTDPKLIPNWWGPSKYSTDVEQMDVRFGGVWRFVQRDADGNEFAFRGVYHHVSAPERSISTFEWEGLPGHVALHTVSLEEVDGKTRYTSVSVFQTVADRDGMVQSGMDAGVHEGMDRLAAVIQGLASR
jgi:uncharacterized protein YndB with AHSA1/START domain